MDLLSTSRRAFRRAAQKLECMMPHEFHENSFGGGDSNRVRNRGGSSWLSDRSFHTSDSIYGSSTWRSAAGSLLSMLPLTSQLRKRRHSLAKLGTVNVPPINRLPTEVLCFIFIICADNDQLLALDSTFVPFRLTHVCALWRQIALDLPVLWHRIDLNLNSCLGTGRHSKLASICVERARGLGLDVSYHEFTRDNLLDGTLPDDLELHEETKLCHCLLNFIVKHLAQIKRLDITVGEESACHVPDPQIFERLYSGPSLADLTWHAYDCTSYVVECPVNVPWQQLVELNLHACPITQNMLMYILDKAVSLQRATTRLYCTDVAMPRARLPIRHTSLQYISLEGDGPLDTVFTVCSFPALRSLNLRSDTGRDADPNGWPFLQPDLLTRIVKQAKAGLESLCLDSCGTINESTLVSVFGLPQMSTLVELAIFPSQSVITERFISLLHPRSGTVPMPKLENLVLERCTTADGVIADMLLARRAKTDSLRYVMIGYAPENNVGRSRPRPRDRVVIKQFKSLEPEDPRFSAMVDDTLDLAWDFGHRVIY